MKELIKAWFLDPAAILFLVSLTFLLWLGLRVVSRAPDPLRDSTYKQTPGQYVILCALWCAIWLVFTAPVLVNPLVNILEGSTGDEALCDSEAPIVVLAGGVDTVVATGQFEFLSRASQIRAVAAWRHVSQHPDVGLIATGGPVGSTTEADLMASFWRAMGIADARISVEPRAMNTRENALFVKELLENYGYDGHSIRLLTSALHMPRAERVFNKVLQGSGLSVCPLAVGRLADPDVPLWAVMPQTTALVKFDQVFHEAVALLVYRLRGWI